MLNNETFSNVCFVVSFAFPTFAVETLKTSNMGKSEYDRYLEREAEEWNEFYNNPEESDDDAYSVPVNEGDTYDDIFRKLGQQILRGNKRRKTKKMKK